MKDLKKMIHPLLSAALLFAPFVPKMIDYLSQDDPDQIASQTIKVATDITQCDSPEAALMRLMDEPDLKDSFVTHMTSLLLSLEESKVRNIDAARARDLALAALGSPRRGDWMVVLAAGGLISSLLALTFFKDILSGEVIGIISTICGIFGSCLKDAFGFEFGSSRSSREKDFLFHKFL
jgi:hypothetical protein